MTERWPRHRRADRERLACAAGPRLLQGHGSGFVYHANYLKFCERGRSDFLRLIGIHHHELH